MQFLLLGGFLGSGKTTALVRLANMLAEQGKQVGIISNDQAEHLVDTETFRTAGFPAEEVAGGCFCCKFDDLIAAAGRVGDGRTPDVILAEPVGSCTDIVATVIRPLQQLYAGQFQVAPYVALLDPDRAWQALAGTGPAAFSAKVTYIFKLQQHEADIVAINKVDALSPEKRAALLPLIQQNFPNARVIEISARSGEGFDELLAAIGAAQPAGRNSIDVDYDIYADGEAELGWMNATVRLTATDSFDGDEFLVASLTEIQRRCREHGVEPAHVKATFQAGKATGTANVVDSSQPAALSRLSQWRGFQADLLINARVQSEPDQLCAIVEVGDCRGGWANRHSGDIRMGQEFLPRPPATDAPDGSRGNIVMQCRFHRPLMSTTHGVQLVELTQSRRQLQIDASFAAILHSLQISHATFCEAGG